MKKIICGALAGLMLLLSGCGSEKNKLPSGFQPDFTVSSYIYGSMAATEDGYFANMGWHGYYIDGETLEVTIFCADPACNHAINEDNTWNLDCMAQRLSCALGAIQYYDGELYFKRGDYSNPDRGYLILTLQAIRSDASGLRDVQQLYNGKLDRWPEIASSNFGYSFAILRDYIMFCPRPFVVKVGKLGEPIEDAKELFTYDTASTYFNGSEAHWDIWVDGGYFYYCGLNYSDGVKTGRPTQLLYRYDPVTEENTLVWRCDEHSNAYWADGWYLRDGIFYYYISERQYEDVEAGVYRCNLATMETTKITGCAAGDEADFDSEYIYLMDYDANIITVLSLETGEEIAALDFGAGVEASGFTPYDYLIIEAFPEYGVVGADDKWLFVMCRTQEGYKALYAIGKDHFADNEWKLIIVDSHDGPVG